MAMPHNNRVRRYFAAKQPSTAQSPNYVYNNCSNGSKCNNFRTNKLFSSNKLFASSKLSRFKLRDSRCRCSSFSNNNLSRKRIISHSTHPTRTRGATTQPHTSANNPHLYSSQLTLCHTTTSSTTHLIFMPRRPSMCLLSHSRTLVTGCTTTSAYQTPS